MRQTIFQSVAIPFGADASAEVAVPVERWPYRLSRVIVSGSLGGLSTISPYLEVFDLENTSIGRFGGGVISPNPGLFQVIFAPGILPNLDGVSTGNCQVFWPSDSLYGLMVPIPGDLFVESGMTVEVRLDGATPPGSGADAITSVRLVRYLTIDDGR